MVTQDLAANLDEIFSILPAAQADEARQQALQNFVGGFDMAHTVVSWVTLEDDGTFIEGGRTDLAGFSNSVGREPDEDENLAKLVRFARNGGARSGHMEFDVLAQQAYWFVPILLRDRLGQARTALRGFLLNEKLFCEILDLFNLSTGITKAEKRLAFQLSCGLSVKQAAAHDDLNVETKRSQLKSLSGKLQCNGQTELVRLLLGQMAYLLSVTDSEESGAKRVSEFIGQHLLPDTRMVLQRLPAGNILRILEKGPLTGSPVLLMHGMLWPILFDRDLPILRALNIRLIMPLRSGYLAAQSSGDVYGRPDTLSNFLADVAAFHTLVLRQKVPVLGHSYGGAFAIEYAAQHPELVERLTIVSLNPGEKDIRNEGFIGKMFMGLRSIANRRGTFRFITWQFRKYFADERTVARVLRGMFDRHQADLALIDGTDGRKPIYPWFVELYQRSIPGIADDFAFVMADWEERLAQINAPTTFIHGEHDPVVDVAVIAELARHGGVDHSVTVPGGGHHLIATHPADVWPYVVATDE